MADIYQPIAGPVNESPKKVIRYKDIAATDGAGNSIYLPEVFVNNIAGGGGSTGGAATIADGADVAQGARSDTPASNDTGTFSLIALIKRLLGKIPGLGQSTMSGSLPVTFASDQPTLSVSVTGGATATNQATTNTSLSSIDTKLTNLTNGTQTTQITNFPTTQNIRITDNPGNFIRNLIDTGGAVLGAVGNLGVAAFGYILGNGQWERLGAVSSNITTGVSSLMVNMTPVSGANAAPSRNRQIALSTTGVVIKATGGNVYGWNLINPNTTSVVVKFYDKTTAATSSDTPIETIVVPAIVSPNVSNSVFLQNEGNAQFNCATGISIRCCTGLADNDNTAPTTPIISTVSFR